MEKKKRVVVLTGAGISAESGIATFRGAGGLWEGHDIMDVASPEGWARNPELVLQFYNQRRRQLKEVAPNEAHRALVRLEAHYETIIITQNVDDLHERAGSSHIIHLHGELKKARSTTDPTLVYPWEDDLNLGDTCEKGSQLRPHIVWFGEEVPEIWRAASVMQSADYVLIIGTSMQVYPAAGLVGYAPPEAHIWYIDPKPATNYDLQQMRHVTIIKARATQGVPRLVDQLIERAKKK